MPLVIELRSRNGETLRRTGESPPRVVFPVPPIDDESYPLLRLVDLYGDTFFSSYQMRGIRPEMRRLKEIASSERQRRLLEEVDGFAALCEASPHSFLVFVGD